MAEKRKVALVVDLYDVDVSMSKLNRKFYRIYSVISQTYKYLPPNVHVSCSTCCSEILPRSAEHLPQ